MEQQKILEYNLVVIKILMKLEKDITDIHLYEDMLGILKTLYPVETKQAYYYSSKLKAFCYLAIEKNINVYDVASVLDRLLLLESQYYFDSYMQCLESKRPMKERFYLPRRKQLKEAVDAIQMLNDNELDELFISMPPRVGKTTLLLFYVTWIIGKNSELSNLYSAYSDVITSAFYDGILEIIGDNTTYRWKEIFPNSEIKSTDARDETIDVNRKKRYPSITCRSLYGTLNGACDCAGTLISDDLIGGIEEALNKDRLVSAWSKVDNNLIPRAKEHAKLLWCGTRWSVADPAGNRISMLMNDKAFANRRYKFINIPALNKDEESNFDYLYNVGFSTSYYKERRASFEKMGDSASWLAQYMGEPVERTGLLFAPEDLKYFNGILPDKEPDRIFMAVDVAWGGGDFLSAPIAYQFGKDIYISDVVFNSGDKYITRPLVISKIIEHQVQASRFEANNGGDEYKEYVETELNKKSYKLNITSKRAVTTTKKEIRIYDHAPEIREFYFLEPSKRSSEYSKFMENLCLFSISGKNKHDDAPDSLSQLCDMIGSISNKPQIFKRPF